MTFSINESIRATRYDRDGEGVPVLRDPCGVMIHSCEGTRKSSIPWLTTDKRSGVSCNAYVCRNGDIFEFARDRLRTWHGGRGDYDGVTNLNDFIGIECEHKQGQDWPAVQLDALAWYVEQKIATWKFPQKRIIVHRWGAKPKGRKIDPTDWNDADFSAWVARLYAVDTFNNYRQAWGDAFPFRPEFGICQRYMRELDRGNDLGAATTDETTVGAFQVQAFTYGLIAFRNGQTEVVKL